MTVRIRISDNQYEVRTSMATMGSPPGEWCEECGGFRSNHKSTCTLPDYLPCGCRKDLVDREGGVHLEACPARCPECRQFTGHKMDCSVSRTEDLRNLGLPRKDEGLFLGSPEQHGNVEGYTEPVVEGISPQTPGVVIGYKRQQTPADIALVNFSKELELKVGQLIQDLDEKALTVEAAHRNEAIELVREAAQTFRVGFMLAARSVFLPVNPYGDPLE